MSISGEGCALGSSSSSSRGRLQVRVDGTRAESFGNELTDCLQLAGRVVGVRRYVEQTEQIPPTISELFASICFVVVVVVVVVTDSLEKSHL